jgi:hypothetical protein
MNADKKKQWVLIGFSGGALLDQAQCIRVHLRLSAVNSFSDAGGIKRRIAAPPLR